MTEQNNILTVFRKLRVEIQIAYIAIIPIVLGACITLLQGNYRLGDMVFALGNLLATFCCLLYLIRNGEYRRTIFWKFTIVLLSLYLISAVFQIQHWPYGIEINHFARLAVFLLYLAWFINRKEKKIKEILKLFWAALVFGAFTFFPGYDLTIWFLATVTLLLIIAIETLEKNKNSYSQ